MIALTLMLGLIALWRRLPGYGQASVIANVLIMTCGVVLIGYQLGGFAYAGGA